MTECVTTHAQPAAVVDDGTRARMERGARLCRQDRVRWQAMVRLTDSLMAQGLSQAEARKQALTAFGA